MYIVLSTYIFPSLRKDGKSAVSVAMGLIIEYYTINLRMEQKNRPFSENRERDALLRVRRNDFLSHAKYAKFAQQP